MNEIKDRVIAVRLDAQTDRALKIMAQQRGEAASVFVRDLIRQAAAERLKTEVRPSRAA